MKLLSPKDVADRKQGEVSRDILRTKTVKELADKQQNRLAEAEAKFELALANQHVRWQVEENEAHAKLDVLAKEIKIAEERKGIALIPIDEEREKVHTLVKEAESALLKAKEIETHNEELTTLLEERLDSVSTQEEVLIEREQILAIKELAMDEQRKTIASRQQDLVQGLDNLAVGQFTLAENLRKWKTEVELRELGFNSREESIAKKEALLSESIKQ